jgi:corticosteroid 11-beta-dehydrogenase isozyme 1
MFVAVLAVFLGWAYGPGWSCSQSELTEAYQGKKVIVCGSSYGIGRHIALDLAKAGAHLILTARSKNKLEGVAQECRDMGAKSVAIFPTDLSTKEGSKSMVDFATKSMGGVDVLVLNHIIGMYDDWAGTIMTAHKEGKVDQQLDWVDRLFRVNILSYIYISTYALPELGKSGSGRIIAVGSMAGRQGLARVAPYSSTKHAMFGYFDSLRQDILASPDPKTRSIGITTGVLGAFSTETAKAGTAGKLDDGMVPWNDPRVASHDLLKAGARKWQTVFTPWHQLRVASLLHGLAPELMEGLTRYITLSGETSMKQK